MTTLTRASPPAKCREPSSHRRRLAGASRPLRGAAHLLQPCRAGGEPLLRKYVNDPANWRGLMMRPPTIPAANASGSNRSAETARTTSSASCFGKAIGLIRRDRPAQGAFAGSEGDFGINIGDRGFQNKGYGTEAVLLCLRYGFEELNLNRIRLSVFSNNPGDPLLSEGGFVQRMPASGGLPQRAVRGRVPVRRSQGRMGTEGATMVPAGVQRWRRQPGLAVDG